MSELHDEFDRIERLRSGSDDYQKEFFKIHNEKLKRIRRVRISMWGFYIACHVYKGNYIEYDFLEEIKKDTDFDSLAIIIRDKYGDKYGDRFLITGEGNFDQDKSIIDKLFSLDYSPPSNIISIYNHLGVLECCYEIFTTVPPTLLYFSLDLSLSKLLSAAYTTAYIHLRHGNTELTRQKKATASILMKKNKKRDITIIIFYKMETDGMTFNKITEDIADKIKDIGISIHPKTVGRYLMSDSKVKADLKAMGIIDRQM